MEGICYSLRDAFDSFPLDSFGIKEIRVTGGVAKSQLWAEILANVLNKTIYPIESSEGAVYGAAMLAGLGSEVFTAETLRNNACLKAGKAVNPTSDANLYQQYYTLFQSLHTQITPSFSVLSQILSEDE